MSARRTTAMLAIVALFCTCPTAIAGQSNHPPIWGEVIDASGAVIPGVTVTATATNGQSLATTVTDETGRYGFAALPAGTVTLAFELQGFAPSTSAFVVQPGIESKVVHRLDVAPLSATVDVRALTPRIAPPPSAPLRQAPALQPVPAYDRDTICGPSKPGALTQSLGTVLGSRDPNEKRLYTEGAELLVDAGMADGLQIGRHLIVGRYDHVAGDATSMREHSSGLLQIVQAGDESAVAVVVYACDEIRQGDFLAPLTIQSRRDPGGSGVADYDDAGRILFADEGQMLGAPRRLMVIDRGAGRGTFVGQRFTLFRQRPASGEREAVGRAVAVAVRDDSATIRIEQVIDAITAGDWAAPEIAGEYDLR